MGVFNDILGFEKFNLKDMLSKVKDKPESLLLGALDPLGAGIWSGITGRDYQPAVNAFGGPTQGAFNRAEQAGVNTGPANAAHQAAQAVASMYAGGYGLDKLGGLVGAGATGNPAATASAGGTTAAAPSAAPSPGFDWSGAAQVAGQGLQGMGQEQEALITQLAMMGPPPQLPVQPANVAGTAAVGEQYKQAMQPGPAPLGGSPVPYGLGLV